MKAKIQLLSRKIIEQSKHVRILDNEVEVLKKEIDIFGNNIRKYTYGQTSYGNHRNELKTQSVEDPSVSHRLTGFSRNTRNSLCSGYGKETYLCQVCQDSIILKEHFQRHVREHAPQDLEMEKHRITWDSYGGASGNSGLSKHSENRKDVTVCTTEDED